MTFKTSKLSLQEASFDEAEEAAAAICACHQRREALVDPRTPRGVPLELSRPSPTKALYTSFSKHSTRSTKSKPPYNPPLKLLVPWYIYYNFFFSPLSKYFCEGGGIGTKHPTSHMYPPLGVPPWPCGVRTARMPVIMKIKFARK